MMFHTISTFFSLVYCNTCPLLSCTRLTLVYNVICLFISLSEYTLVIKHCALLYSSFSSQYRRRLTHYSHRTSFLVRNPSQVPVLFLQSILYRGTRFHCLTVKNIRGITFMRRSENLISTVNFIVGISGSSPTSELMWITRYHYT